MLPSGLVTLTFRAAGFAPLRVPNLLLQSGSRTQDVALSPGDADAGLPDLARDAGPTYPAGPVTIVSTTQGSGRLADGGAVIPPPLLTREGDLVLVGIFRLFPPSAELTTQSWRLEVQAPAGNGDVSWLWRRAAADESLRADDYVFIGGTQGSHWAVTVLRGATVVSAIGTTAINGRAVSFPEAVATPGDLVLDVVNEEGGTSCTSDAGFELEELVNFHVMRLPVGPPGRVPPTSWTCLGPGFTAAGYTSQFRVLAAP